MKKEINEEIEFPQGVSVSYESNNIIVKGPKGEVKRHFFDPKIKVKVEGNKLNFINKKSTKREVKKIYSYKAHLKNIITGVQNPFVYKLKICSGHFPMNVTVSGDKFVVKNFLGEKIPREMKIKKGVNIKIIGDQINVESPDIELAGNTASDIEQLVRISKRDLRIFQDGIYLTDKAGEQI